MAITLTLDATGPGKAGRRPALALADKPLTFAPATLTFDSSYPTGGEDITALTGLFKTCLGVLVVNQPVVAGTGKQVYFDSGFTKALLATNAATPAEVANASDQSSVANVEIVAFGYM